MSRRIHNLRRVYLASSAVVALLSISAICRANEPIRWKFTVGEKLDYGTRSGLHPLLRADIENEAIRIF